MIITSHQYPVLQQSSRPQESHSSGFFFSSRCTSIDADTPQISLMDYPPNPHKAVHNASDDLPLHRMSPLPKLKPLPDFRYPSGGISEVSELFKVTSIGQELKDDRSARVSPTASSPELGPLCGQDSPLGFFSTIFRPIHLHHLSERRLSSCEIVPFFSLIPPPPSGHSYNTKAHLHCPRFPHGHNLNPRFVELYQLEDELGSGGYGFVMTARHRLSRQEVAVKFIVKERVPEHAWMEDELLGRLPTEIVLLNSLNHENIIKFLDLFEDNLYFYLVCFFSCSIQLCLKCMEIRCKNYTVPHGKVARRMSGKLTV